MLTRFLPVGLLFLLVGCNNGQQADPWNGTTKLRVVTTFAPIQCFAMNIGGDDVEVRGLLTTQGPHHADPPTSQARMLAKANLFFGNGLHVDDSIVRKMTDSMGKGGPKVIMLGDELPKEILIEGECPCCKEEGETHEHDHDHKSYDGHVWLGIETAKKMVEMIGSVSAENTKQATYSSRAAAYITKLDKLHSDGKAMLKDKKNRVILPFHASLAYFAKSFDLKLIGPIQEVPGQEPSAKHMDEIIKQCLAEKVRVIAVEPQYNAETSAKSLVDALKAHGVTDLEIIVIDPLETCLEGEMSPDWYEKKMRANLETLAKALR
jgi:ABC-type Zn uptake system ZnuABC Zn-binding protein ZnuA